MYPVYIDSYWDSIKGDNLPDEVDWTTLGFSLNSSVSTSGKALQGLVSAIRVGAIGTKTVTAVEQKDHKQIIEEMLDLQQDFLEGLSTFKKIRNYHYLLLPSL